VGGRVLSRQKGGTTSAGECRGARSGANEAASGTTPIVSSTRRVRTPTGRRSPAGFVYAARSSRENRRPITSSAIGETRRIWGAKGAKRPARPAQRLCWTDLRIVRFRPENETTTASWTCSITTDGRSITLVRKPDTDDSAHSRGKLSEGHFQSWQTRGRRGRRAGLLDHAAIGARGPRAPASRLSSPCRAAISRFARAPRSFPARVQARAAGLPGRHGLRSRRCRWKCRGPTRPTPPPSRDAGAAFAGRDWQGYSYEWNDATDRRASWSIAPARTAPSELRESASSPGGIRQANHRFAASARVHSLATTRGRTSSGLQHSADQPAPITAAAATSNPHAASRRHLKGPWADELRPAQSAGQGRAARASRKAPLPKLTPPFRREPRRQ